MVVVETLGVKGMEISQEREKSLGNGASELWLHVIFHVIRDTCKFNYECLRYERLLKVLCQAK